MKRMEQYKFRIISVKKLDDLIVTYNELNTLIETLNIYNKFLLGKKESNVLNGLRIKFEINKISDLIEILEAAIIEKCDLDKLVLSCNQVIGLIEASLVYQEYLKTLNGSSELEAINIISEANMSIKLLDYLQKLIEYDYNIACTKCEKKRKRNNDMMGLGESGMVQSARINSVHDL